MISIIVLFCPKFSYRLNFEFATINSSIPLLSNLKFQASSHFTARFVSDLVENPKDRFYYDVAQIELPYKYFYYSR